MYARSGFPKNDRITSGSSRRFFRARTLLLNRSSPFLGAELPDLIMLHILPPELIRIELATIPNLLIDPIRPCPAPSKCLRHILLRKFATNLSYA